MFDSEFVKRQITHLEKSLSDYGSGQLPLQTLIGNFEFVRDANDWLAEQEWKTLDPILVDLESFNSVIVEKGKLPTRELAVELERSVSDLKNWLQQLKKQRGC